MNNEQQKAKELAELLTAFADGKPLQYQMPIGYWVDYTNDATTEMICTTKYPIRIKPETKRIALNQQNLIDRELSGKTISLLYSGTVLHISKYYEDGVFFAGGNSFSYEYMKDNYIFLDGTPCHKEVECE